MHFQALMELFDLIMEMKVRDMDLCLLQLTKL
jgi:hypothetical protein